MGRKPTIDKLSEVMPEVEAMREDLENWYFLGTIGNIKIEFSLKNKDVIYQIQINTKEIQNEKNLAQLINRRIDTERIEI